MKVRIYKPAKTAMQSGAAQDQGVGARKRADAQGNRPADGLDRSRDTMQQVQLALPTLEEAKATPRRTAGTTPSSCRNARHVRPKAYADNFAYNRVGRWTH